ncbi:MAG: T9SS type A sorting domain-containing protein [Bacteroidetes bacterium]|nr:T9SS type A sorting domain-containing protein [Bacteroidota bacterium]
MKTIRLFWIFLFIPFLSQAQDWDWATSWGGASDDHARGMAIGNHNDVYVAGTFRGVLFTPIDTLISNGSRDAILTKLNQTTGEIVWIRTIGGPEADVSEPVVLDSAGNIYYCGLFTSVMNINGSPVFTNGSSDIFLAKYDTAGTLLWLKTYGGNGADYISHFSYTRDHHLVFAGYFTETLQMDTISIPSGGKYDGMIGKMDLDGNVLWVSSLGGPGDERLFQAYEAPDGSFYSHGDMNDTFTVGTETFKTAGYIDALTTRWDQNGNLLWVRQGGGTMTDQPTSGTVDNDGNYYIAGYFGLGAQFGEIVLNHVDDQEGFIIKYQPDGTEAWATTINGNGGSYFYSIDYVNDDALFFSGKLQGSPTWENQSWTGINETDIFYGKINSQGKLLWGAFEGGPKLESGWRIKWKDDYAYMLGWFEDTCNIGTHQVVSKGGLDAYITRRHFPFYATDIEKEKLSEFSFNVFPNPNQGSFQLDTDISIFTQTNLNLYDINGRMVKQWQVTPTTPFPLSLETRDLTPGVYFLRLGVHSSQTLSQKIIITE